MATRAFITGLRGTAIAPEERAFLRDASPFGLIVFKRNIVDPSQLKGLINEFRTVCGPDVAVLIDQEGGRVQRMGPPHWGAYPAGAFYGELYRRDPACGLRAAWLGARLMATDLATVGITVDCLPVADVPVADADQVIGDRAYGDTAQQVAAIAAAIAAGLQAGGVLPVVKHLPGHGRATADSHRRLPVVTAARRTLEMTDFAAFVPFAAAPLGMTAHVVFTAFDPDLPATTSPIMIEQVIRGLIGFSGALMSDDLSMGLCRARLVNGSDDRWTPVATSSSIATVSLPRWKRSQRVVRNSPVPPCNGLRVRSPHAVRPNRLMSRRRELSLRKWWPVIPAS